MDEWDGMGEMAILVMVQNVEGGIGRRRSPKVAFFFLLLDGHLLAYPKL